MTKRHHMKKPARRRGEGGKEGGRGRNDERRGTTYVPASLPDSILGMKAEQS